MRCILKGLFIGSILQASSSAFAFHNYDKASSKQYQTGNNNVIMGGMEDNDQSSGGWDDYADDWDNQPGVREFSQNTKNVLMKQDIPESWSQATILDLGCGTGILSRMIAGECKSIVSIDPSGKMVDVLKKHIENNEALQNILPVKGILDDATAGEFLEKKLGPFDAVVANSVCSFVPDYDALLLNIHKLLKPGGYFVQADFRQTKEPLTENQGDGFHEAFMRKAYTKAELTVITIEPMTVTENNIIVGVSKKE
ncbi:unnamed protein product [Cylindrotheca closterium]|uniref:Methyltransferase type 12 domain-containing protein n=1 Tax=Cylindrotheca closterium TaxID=2856 RepID=A0AAD2JJZ1_9STRA|nr:unnamed protein product [Cylindrotheca closterium]